MSFCQKCGAPIEEGAKFCTICGNPVEEKAAEAVQQTVYEAPVYETTSYEAPSYEATPVQEYNTYESVSQVEAPVYGANYEVESLSKSSMVLGIVGLCLSLLGFTSIVGIILSAVGLSKAKKVMNILNVRALSGKAKAGHILGKAGIIAGILMTIFMVIYFAIVVLAVIAGQAGGYYY